jgi:hypothetical protein
LDFIYELQYFSFLSNLLWKFHIFTLVLRRANLKPYQSTRLPGTSPLKGEGGGA